jgi:LacI family transcriptional regulator
MRQSRRSPGGLLAPFVGIDNSAAGAAVADFLKTRRPEGRVAAIHGPLTSSATADRISAFCHSFEGASGRLAARDVVTAPGLDPLEIWHSAMNRLLARGATPTSIFCSSDLIAFGAYRSLRAAGRTVPGDVLLVGFDDSPLNDWVAPWLSSVRVPYRDFGTTIVSSLERIWRHEPSATDLLGFELIERQ